jgi:hypothetical protein
MKDIDGFEGLYQINENGDVFSLVTNRYLKQRFDSKKKYKTASLSKNGKQYYISIHRIVCQLYNYKDNIIGLQVDHIDGDKYNNNYKNLRWCTPKENLNNPITREKLFKRKKYNRAVYKYDLNLVFIKKYDSIKSAEIENNISSPCIIACCKGITRKSKGFIFKYQPIDDRDQENIDKQQAYGFSVGDKVVTPYGEGYVWKVTYKSVHVKHWDEKRDMWMFSKYLTEPLHHSQNSISVLTHCG